MKHQGQAVTLKDAKKGRSEVADEPDVFSNLRPNKRPRRVLETEEAPMSAPCSPVAMERTEAVLTEVEEDSWGEPVENVQILKKRGSEVGSSASGTDVTALAASGGFVLSAASLKARGRQKIPLENAKGLPERLGDMPLRLIIGGNNPSDHAW